MTARVTSTAAAPAATAACCGVFPLLLWLLLWLLMWLLLLRPTLLQLLRCRLPAFTLLSCIRIRVLRRHRLTTTLLLHRLATTPFGGIPRRPLFS